MSDCCSSEPASEFPNHTDQEASLNRLIGQIEGVKKMIAAQRYCPEIMTQLRAARAAMRTIEAAILERHLQSCVTNVMRLGDDTARAEKIAEIKEIFKRFESS